MFVLEIVGEKEGLAILAGQLEVASDPLEISVKQKLGVGYEDEIARIVSGRVAVDRNGRLIAGNQVAVQHSQNPSKRLISLCKF